MSTLNVIYEKRLRKIESFIFEKTIMMVNTSDAITITVKPKSIKLRYFSHMTII